MDQYQKELAQWFKKNNWPYWKPHEILARLFEEGGELARLVNHLYGPKKKKRDEAIRASFDKVMKRDKNRF